MINTIIYHMQQGKKIIVNINLKGRFIKDVAIVCSQNMKKNQLIKKNLSDMPPLEDDEEVKEEKGINVLTPNKLLTRLPILLAEIKAGKNS